MIAAERSWLEGERDVSPPQPAPITADFTAFEGKRSELVEALAAKAWELLRAGDVWGSLAASDLAMGVAEFEGVALEHP